MNLNADKILFLFNETKTNSKLYIISYEVINEMTNRKWTTESKKLWKIKKV